MLEEPRKKLSSSFTEDKILNKLLEISQSVLNTHAPVKHKFVRAIQVPFTNKKLEQEIMNRSKLRNNFLNNKFIEDKQAHNTQRKKCEELLRKTKKDYYSIGCKKFH